MFCISFHFVWIFTTGANIIIVQFIWHNRARKYLVVRCVHAPSRLGATYILDASGRPAEWPVFSVKVPHFQRVQVEINTPYIHEFSKP